MEQNGFFRNQNEFVRRPQQILMAHNNLLNLQEQRNFSLGGQQPDFFVPSQVYAPQFMSALTQQNQLMMQNQLTNLYGIQNQSLLQFQPNFGVAPLTVMPNFAPIGQTNSPFNSFGGTFMPGVPLINVQNSGLYQQPSVPIMNVQNGGLYQQHTGAPTMNVQQPMLLMASKKQHVSKPQKINSRKEFNECGDHSHFHKQKIENRPAMNSPDFESGFEDDSSQMEDFETQMGAENFGSISFNEIESDDEPNSDHIHLTNQNNVPQQAEHQQVNQFGFNSNHDLQGVIDQNCGLANQMRQNSDNFTETSPKQPTTQVFRNEIPFKQYGSNKRRPTKANVQFQQTGSGIHKRKSFEQFEQAALEMPKKSRRSEVSPTSNHSTESIPERTVNQNAETTDIHKNNNSMVLQDYFPKYKGPIQPLNDYMKSVIESYTMNELVRKSYEPSQVNQEQNNQQSTIRSDLNMAPPIGTTVSSTPDRQKILCNLCNKDFTTKSSYTRHMKKHQAGVKKFLCPVCQYPCANKSNLKAHHERKHKNMILPNESIEVVIYENDNTV